MISPTNSPASIEGFPRVSVVVPVLAGGLPLERALHSVVRQTYPHWEIVLPYTNSLADVPAVVELFTPSHHGGGAERTLCAPLPASTLGAARNAAIRRGTGALIALLDPRDVWPNDRLQRCVEYLREHPQVDVLYSPTKPANEARRSRRTDCPEGWILGELFAANPIHDSTAVFYRRVWERVGGFDESLKGAVSHNFWLRAAVGHRFGLLHAAPVATAPPMGDRREELIATARMLYRFYEQQGGKERLDRVLANRVLARVCQRVGWACVRAGDGTLAELAFGVAAWYRPSLASWLGYLTATLQRRWRRQPVYGAAHE
jgi:hypothetical protein